MGEGLDRSTNLDGQYILKLYYQSLISQWNIIDNFVRIMGSQIPSPPDENYKNTAPEHVKLILSCAVNRKELRVMQIEIKIN
jgi:hypothetical protein